MGDVRTSLRALAHPGAVLALVMLVLNDHVLKQAWPGWVTGKLSDVAGLVVAPLLLAAVLRCARRRAPFRWRLPRRAQASSSARLRRRCPAPATCGASWFSDVMRADVTDLLALPALCAAWSIHRRTARSERRRVASYGLPSRWVWQSCPSACWRPSATSCTEKRATGRSAWCGVTSPVRRVGEETRLAVGELVGARFSVDRSATSSRRRSNSTARSTSRREPAWAAAAGALSARMPSTPPPTVAGPGRARRS